MAADVVASQVILDGERLFIGKYTNISGGDGETAVVKIDVSTLAKNAFGYACNGVKINKIWALTQGMSVDILWDATTDVVAMTLPENQMYQMDFSFFGGLPNNAAPANVTGDVAFTTVNATGGGDRYTIILECIKTYATS
jgi:hypothetical protein